MLSISYHRWQWTKSDIESASSMWWVQTIYFSLLLRNFYDFPQTKQFFSFQNPVNPGKFWEIWSLPFPVLHFLTHATGEKNYFTAILSAHNRNWFHLPRSSQRAMTGVPLLENILWTAFMLTFQLRKKLPCSRSKTATTRPAFPFLGNQETYSQQLYIQFIMHNKVPQD